MRVELHRCADDVRRLCARAVQQAHLVHGKKQLAVGRLEAVDLRDGARENYAHRVGHEVFADRRNNRLLHYLARAVDYALCLGGLWSFG